MISINLRDSRPIYEQVKDGFRRLIISGALPKDYKMPSVRELAATLAINPNNIQRAYRNWRRRAIFALSREGAALCAKRERRTPRERRSCWKS